MNRKVDKKREFSSRLVKAQNNPFFTLEAASLIRRGFLKNHFSPFGLARNFCHTRKKASTGSVLLTGQRLRRQGFGRWTLNDGLRSSCSRVLILVFLGHDDV